MTPTEILRWLGFPETLPPGRSLRPSLIASMGRVPYPEDGDDGAQLAAFSAFLIGAGPVGEPGSVLVSDHSLDAAVSPGGGVAEPGEGDKESTNVRDQPTSPSRPGSNRGRNSPRPGPGNRQRGGKGR